MCMHNYVRMCLCVRVYVSQSQSPPPPSPLAISTHQSPSLVVMQQKFRVDVAAPSSTDVHQLARLPVSVDDVIATSAPLPFSADGRAAALVVARALQETPHGARVRHGVQHARRRNGVQEAGLTRAWRRPEQTILTTISQMHLTTTTNGILTYT